MEITIKTNRLTCSVFGHNLKYRIKKAKKSQVLACATCQSKQVGDDLENLDMYPFKNQEIRTAVHELFLLQSQYYRKRISM